MNSNCSITYPPQEGMASALTYQRSSSVENSGGAYCWAPSMPTTFCLIPAGVSMEKVLDGYWDVTTDTSKVRVGVGTAPLSPEDVLYKVD